MCQRAAELAEFEAKLRRQLKVPEEDDWLPHIPEGNRGDRIFAEWQRLAVEARKEEDADEQLAQ